MADRKLKIDDWKGKTEIFHKTEEIKVIKVSFEKVEIDLIWESLNTVRIRSWTDKISDVAGGDS